MQGRIDEPNGDRETVHGLEDADEVAPLKRPQLAQGLAAGFGVVGDDHFLDGQLPFGAAFGLLEVLEEHVLGAAEADALGAHFAGLAGVVGRIGVGADAERAGSGRPTSSWCDSPWAFAATVSCTCPWYRRRLHCHRA